MRELTQTTTGKIGNCWQTAVACLLDVDPERMPPQASYWEERVAQDGTVYYSCPYHNPLQAYLRVHHGLAYVELPYREELLGQLRVAEPGWHIMTGTTERSASLGGMRHVVVGRYGKMVWDPHPARAGLIGEIQWAFLVPYPERWQSRLECVCPACASRGARS